MGAARSRRGRRRSLTREEQQLWGQVARFVTPLPGATVVEPSDLPVESRTLPSNQAASTPTSFSARNRLAAPHPAEPALAPIDRKTRQKLARGRDAIDARIDLHGQTQIEAHRALRRFLLHAQAAGYRYVLIITGKGGDREQGVLRRQVPLWLEAPEFRGLVVGFDMAHAGHGGSGALYVRVRRKRHRTTE